MALNMLHIEGGSVTNKVFHTISDVWQYSSKSFLIVSSAAIAADVYSKKRRVALKVGIPTIIKTKSIMIMTKS